MPNASLSRSPENSRASSASGTFTSLRTGRRAYPLFAWTVSAVRPVAGVLLGSLRGREIGAKEVPDLGGALAVDEDEQAVAGFEAGSTLRDDHSVVSAE